MILENLAVKLLRKEGYHVRSKNMPKPKVGDVIRFRTGGDWSQNGYYESTATITKLDKDHPERPFEKYGYMWVERRNKQGALEHSGVVHPYEVIEVIPPNLTGDSNE